MKKTYRYTCRHCNKPQTFKPDGPQIVHTLEDLEDKPVKGRKYFPICPNCGKGNEITVPEKS